MLIKVHLQLFNLEAILEEGEERSHAYVRKIFWTSPFPYIKTQHASLPRHYFRR
jgi:hypothetical protein